MKTLLERAVAHLLNGDEEGFDALFHKFIVERARQVHESLRQDDSDELDENWDSEITEENYFGDEELADSGEDVDADADVDADVDAADADVDPAAGDMDAADAEMSDADMDAGDDFGAEGEESLEDKVDHLTDKIDDLVAEFDRLMADETDDVGDDVDADADMDADADFDSDMDGEVTDMGGEESDVEDDSDDLADRMEDDMGDEESPDQEPVEESEEPMGDEGDEDDDLADITESVLAELEKISAPSNTDGKNIGSDSVASQKLNPNRVSPVPHHNVMDRIKGEPVMTKGPTHQGYEREAAPPVKGPEGVVKDVRKGNRRKSFKDTMGQVPAKGDASAELNKDFAGGPKPTRSIVDGKKSKG